jgi:oligosaccharide repeat unit polymerase
MPSPRSQEHFAADGVGIFRNVARAHPGKTTLGQNHGFLIGTLILCILIPGLLANWQVTGTTGIKGSVALQILITGWAGLRLARLWARAEPRPFAIIFWVYVYVWIGLSGLVQMVSQTTPWLIPISSSAVWKGQIIVVLGLAFLEVGHLFPSRKTSQDSAERYIVDSRVTVLVVLALVTAPIWFQVVGGFHSLFSTRQELSVTVFGRGSSKNLESGGIKTVFSTVPIFMALYAVIVTQKYKLSRRRSRLVLILLMVATLILNSPVAMPRQWIATILAALLFALPSVQKKPGATRALIIGAIFVSIALFPYAAYFRTSTGFKQPQGVSQSLETKGDYDSFEMITAGVQYTYEEGFRYGAQALGDVFFFIPRSTWPSKAEDTGAFIAEHFHLSFTNLSAPLWIESYIDFGYLGVIAVFFFYGLLMRRADDRFIKGTSPFAQFIIPLLAGYTGILLRGPLLSSMPRLIAMLLIAWLISKRGVALGRRPSPETVPQFAAVTGNTGPSNISGTTAQC